MSDNDLWSTLDLVAVDVEGNGARPPDVVEFAAVPIRRGVIGKPKSWLVRPADRITWHARRVHGITDEMVSGQPPFAEVADEIRHELADAIPVGHNVTVDLGVMGRQLPNWRPAEAFDTLRMARATLDLPSHKLAALVEHFGLGVGMPDGLEPHRAAYDALVTARLLVELAERPRLWTVDELRRVGGLTLTRHEPQPGLFG